MADTLTAEAPNSVIADQGLVYCRFPDGTIEACDSSPMEIMKKIQRGFTPLTDYGQFGSNVYYMANPFEPLFQAGGAHELSVEQIVNLGYHLRPPLVPTCEQHVGQGKEHLSHSGRPGGGSAKAQGCWRGARPVRFPQLDGVEVPPMPDECEFCGRDDFPTTRALKQHQDVMHNDRRQQQALGEAIVSGLHQTGVVGSGGVDAQAIAAAVAATLQALGYGAQRPDPDPEPTPEDDEDDEDQPEIPEPQPEPEPEPSATRQRQLEQLARARAARGQHTLTSDD